MLPPEYQYQFPHSKRLKLPKLKRIKLEYISQNDLVSTWSFKSFASDSPSLSKISSSAPKNSTDIIIKYEASQAIGVVVLVKSLAVKILKSFLVLH